ncbi:MAG: hypothetical protein IJS16_03440, partial [Butyrivibrio sp.]|nr:hypothetical protein [Butyrivibrio sp.]
MKHNIIKRIVTGLVAATMCLALAACGNKDIKQEVAETTEQVTEGAEEASETTEDDGGMMSVEDQIEAVQATLTYMGGLKTADDAAKKIELCMFRNDNGDII